MMQDIATVAGWFMVASFAILLGGAALTALFAIVRAAWRA